ncbi:barstar family protein [Streptomyces fragilis]|uniref:Barstar family protein n=1 Tax=Streptomyces fragilis TaxID=67301 RepID=A0ABV2YJX1_9ACTN|nr:barstar family protein [Streptomyces fragilis]
MNESPGHDGGGYRYALTSDEDDADFWGPSHEAQGLFTPLPGEEDGARQVLLAGCRPRGGLLRSTGHLGRQRASAGNADLDLLDADGTVMGSYFVNDVTVVDARPSARGADLLDLTVTLWCENALPGAEPVWDLIREGRLDRTGLWRDLTPEGRHAWLSVALWSREYRHRGRPDAPAGQVLTLDGRDIVDEESFYCALGEAVNGPCGYFGRNLDALDDCLRGRWGATVPFTLYWDHSAESVARLSTPRPTPQGDSGVVPFPVILEIFADHGVEVVLR